MNHAEYIKLCLFIETMVALADRHMSDLDIGYVASCIMNGKNIHAIKEVRSAMNNGLKDAKDFVDLCRVYMGYVGIDFSRDSKRVTVD